MLVSCVSLDECVSFVDVVLPEEVDDQVEPRLWDDVHQRGQHLQSSFAVPEHNQVMLNEVLSKLEE